jgi:hypothetical protein
MNTQHTPGPWQFGTSSEGSFYKRNIAGADGYHVALTSSRDDSEVDANARLIAAAPELLEALQTMLKHPDTMTAKLVAQVAIAKATGETQ